MKFFHQSSGIYFLFGVVASEVLLMQNPYKNQRALKTLIFEHCEKDYKTIVVSDGSNGIDSFSIQQINEQLYSVILFKELLKRLKAFQYVKKIDAILINTQSSEELIEILENLGKTIWWNVMIPVFILNLPNDNCEIATIILERVWEYKILTSYFLCVENNEVRIYTYNPFTDRAPSNWIKMTVSMEESRWTLYRRKYKKDIQCQELDFDRTKYLDGYQITVAHPVDTDEAKPFLGQFVNYDNISVDDNLIPDHRQIIIDSLAMELNVTLRLYFYENLHSYKKHKTVERQKIKIYQNSSADLIMIRQPLQLSNKSLSRTNLFRRTYPVAWSEYIIVTYNRGYQTLGEKLWDFYGFWIILFTTFVLLITFAVIWFTESRKTAFAVFEVIRLLINHSLYTRMNTLSLRIFFITILIYFLIVQATFNGHLAKFLTKPELRRHPESREDLKEFGYTKIYDSNYVKKHLAVTNKQKTFGSYHTKLCLRHILYKDSSVACIVDHEMLLIYSKRKKKLYFSRKPLETRYKVFSIHKHWPLANRVNLIFLFIEEFGFRQFKFNNFVKSIKDHNVAVIDKSSDDDFHPIKLKNLVFSFSILAIGLITATLSFFVELYKGRQSQFKMYSRVKMIQQEFIINQQLFHDEI